MTPAAAARVFRAHPADTITPNEILSRAERAGRPLGARQPENVGHWVVLTNIGEKSL
jgi:hypothetical protein